MDIRSSKGVQITGPSIKFTGHSHTPQRRCSDSYWSFDKAPNFFMKMGLGITAGGIGAFVGTPAEVALIRMTADGR
jgi:hypothetical protein